MRRETLLALLIGVALADRPASAQTPSVDPGLKPGDMVEVTVWQRDELSGEITVAPNGSLIHPLYRQIRVTGIPADQVEDRVRSFLSAYEANPQLVVQPHYKVAVGGAVNKPDLYDILPGTTVSGAVTQAGGIGERGKRNDVRLVRDGRETRLDLTEPEAMLVTLQSGDQIVVKEKSTNWVSQNILPLLTMALTISNLIAINNQ
jgi:protein involved in polysaccharide export with SLBB domain